MSPCASRTMAVAVMLTLVSVAGSIGVGSSVAATLAE